jgi:NTE family protein
MGGDPPADGIRMSTALILSGGGARAAYQVGVLRGVLEIYGGDDLPFEVICGTSAGAINAVFMAANAHRPRQGVETLYRAWRGIAARDVYDPGWTAVLGNLGRIALAPLRRGNRGAPTSLLDNKPLRGMLGNWLDFDLARENIGRGHLRTLCLTAMDYASGASVAFFEGGASEDWGRTHRCGVRTTLGLDHVIASAAIPILFPAQRIGEAYYGDGALRQLHPISPALKFGASRMLIIGVAAPRDMAEPLPERRMPSIGQMAGHLLNREFIDNLEADIALAQRFNQMAQLLDDEQRARFNARTIETLVITPSVHFNEIAADYLHKQPASLRLLFRLLGASARGAGASFASYLLFDGGFWPTTWPTGLNATSLRLVGVAVGAATRRP